LPVPSSGTDSYSRLSSELVMLMVASCCNFLLGTLPNHAEIVALCVSAPSSLAPSTTHSPARSSVGYTQASGITTPIVFHQSQSFALSYVAVTGLQLPGGGQYVACHGSRFREPCPRGRISFDTYVEEMHNEVGIGSYNAAQAGISLWCLLLLLIMLCRPVTRRVQQSWGQGPRAG
jgi:hypothetical protein